MSFRVVSFGGFFIHRLFVDGVLVWCGDGRVVMWSRAVVQVSAGAAVRLQVSPCHSLGRSYNPLVPQSAGSAAAVEPGDSGRRVGKRRAE